MIFSGKYPIKLKDNLFLRGNEIGAPGRIRTSDTWIRNPVLYPLSYRRTSQPQKVFLEPN